MYIQKLVTHASKNNKEHLPGIIKENEYRDIIKMHAFQ